MKQSSTVRPRASCHRLPVVLLIQKEAGFLPVFKVHGVADAVFLNIHRCKVRSLFTVHRMPALALLHALQLTDGHVVALIYTPTSCPSERSTSSSRENSSSLMSSMPRHSTCATSTLSNRSTVRPGKPSASPRRSSGSSGYPPAP